MVIGAPPMENPVSASGFIRVYPHNVYSRHRLCLFFICTFVFKCTIEILKSLLSISQRHSDGPT